MTDVSQEALAELRGRVMQFKTMSLPCQPMAMHMGTSYLVGDLGKAVDALETALTAAQAENARLRDRQPDYLYDPEDWEYTTPWEDRGEMVENLLDYRGANAVACVRTLIKGPDKWVARIPLDTDGDGEADDWEVQWFDSEDASRAALQEGQKVPVSDFHGLVSEAITEANRAMRKFPQPNYVISKFAEESGEVVKAAIHCAEGRDTKSHVREEMRQTIAMLYRLWVEGDQVHGLPPIGKGGPDQ